MLGWSADVSRSKGVDEAELVGVLASDVVPHVNLLLRAVETVRALERRLLIALIAYVAREALEEHVSLAAAQAHVVFATARSDAPPVNWHGWH